MFTIVNVFYKSNALRTGNLMEKNGCFLGLSVTLNLQTVYELMEKKGWTYLPQGWKKFITMPCSFFIMGGLDETGGF